MSPLRELRMFVSAKASEYAHDEIRSYVAEHAEDLAAAFGVTEERLLGAVAGIENEILAEKILGQIKHTQRKAREARAQAKADAAQSSVGKVNAQWDGDHATLNMPALLAILTKRGALLAFRSEDGFEVAVPMDPLLGLAKLRKAYLTGYVDSNGLHVRWSGGTGGLNLRPSFDRDAPRVIIALPARASAIAA
jgi:hypothetical protein